MRIVGGIYRGRRLAEFEKIGVRPTSDMARESLFNILQNDIVGARFLDLFSGTGAVGIEALSRGAKDCVFCDMNRESIKVINKNLQTVGAENYKVINGDGISLLDRLSCEGQTFDIIFIDPPYESELGLQALGKCLSVIDQNGIVVFESDKEFCGQVEGLRQYDSRRYGKAHLTFFCKESNPD